MADLTVHSTSRSSAEVSDIVLRKTGSTRLVFRSMLVANPRNPEAAVKGTFVFQRKGRTETWEDVPTDPLSSLKKGEGYKLTLDSGEVLNLYRELSALYQLFEQEGIPAGDVTYLRARGALAALADLNLDQLRVFFDANAAAGAELIRRLLSWASRSGEVSRLVRLLESLGHRALADLSAAANAGAIIEALAGWQQNRNNDREEFWQSFFAERSFLLEQLFSWPCTIVAQKAYVGGKSVENRGSKIVDFLVSNRLTESAALVEIKTPATALTGRPYRDGIHNISADLAGSLVQVVTYKASLAETYRTMDRSATRYEVFDPACVVIAGTVSSLETIEKRRTFELFRRQLNGVELVGFDEVFGRLEGLGEVLGARWSSPQKSD